MKKIRFGVVGLGYMGASHARTLAGEVERAELAAVCSSDPAGLAQFPGIAAFDDVHAMLAAGGIDALCVATPHTSHVDIGIAALEKGLHVMMEKPIAVHKRDGERLIAAHTNPRQIFAVMLNVRTRPYIRKVRELVLSGELGKIQRVNWEATAFFRTDTYYADSPWRGTWKGEGGGVLLNQAPHHLDLIQWILGMPKTVRGFCGFGRYHKIEVEDEATAYLEFPDGATGTIVISTGESPGITRIEVAGELGQIIVEKETVTLTRNAVPARQFSKDSPDPMGILPSTEEQVPAATDGGNYRAMFQNFTDAILDGVPLIAPAADGLNSLELANAILLSSMQERTITLPLDGVEYEAQIRKLGYGN